MAGREFKEILSGRRQNPIAGTDDLFESRARQRRVYHLSGGIGSRLPGLLPECGEPTFRARFEAADA